MAAKNIVALGILVVLVVHADEPTAKTLKKCPLGHTTLKDVPIVYGLPPWEGPEVQKWRKAVENFEFVSGGCVSDNDSPKHEVVCTTCRFAHSISSTKTPEYGSWTRSSPDMKSFPQPFSDFVRIFPVPPKSQLKEPVSYTQSLSDGLDVRYESVSYRTTKPPEDIKASIEKWLKEQNIKYRFSSNTHTSTLDSAVRDILSWRTDELSLMIDMHHEHSDKTSWIHATSFKRTRTLSGSNITP
jgi:hypothetical protein